jgi:hypothetical protein
MIEKETANGNGVIMIETENEIEITTVTKENCPYAGIGQKVGDAESTPITWNERSAATPIPRACW